MQSDDILVQKILRGDTQAFEILYRRYFKKIYYTVSSRISNRQDCEDLVQEIFIEILEKLNKFNPKYQFSTWIYTIAHNRSTDFLRKKYKLNEIFLDESQMSENLVEDSEQVKNIIESRVKKLIEKLGDEARKILEMRYLNNMKFKDIALSLGVNLNAIKVAHHRAIRKLQNIYLNIENE